jgi:hypothetical protein
MANWRELLCIHLRGASYGGTPFQCNVTFSAIAQRVIMFLEQIMMSNSQIMCIES